MTLEVEATGSVFAADAEWEVQVGTMGSWEGPALARAGTAAPGAWSPAAEYNWPTVIGSHAQFLRSAVAAGLTVGVLDLALQSHRMFASGIADWATLSTSEVVVIALLPMLVDVATGGFFGTLCWLIARAEIWARERFARCQSSPYLATAVLLSPGIVAVSAYLVDRPSLVREFGESIRMVAIPVAALALAVLPRVLRKATAIPTTRRRRRLLAWGWALVGLGAFAADAFAYRRLYFGFHCIASLAMLGAFSLALRPRTVEARGPWNWPWLAPVVFAATLVGSDAALDSSFRVRFLTVSTTTLPGKVLAIVRLPRRWLRDAPARTPLVIGDAPREAAELRAGLGLELSGQPPHIFLVTFDAVRAQSLELLARAATDGPVVATPVLSSLAAEGQLYERAYSPTADTTGTMGSWVRAGQPRHQSSATLYTRLRERGYQTLCNLPWDYIATTITHSRQRCTYEFWLLALPLLTDAFAAALAEMSAEVPLFAHLHVFETHDRESTGSGAGPEAAYLADIERVDRALGQWLDIARAAGFLEHAVVIVTADHGESLGERGLNGHGSSLYDEQTWVPLVVWSSRGDAVRHPGPVSVGWLGQSILALAGVIPASELVGPFLNSTSPVTMRQGTFIGIVVGDHKLIYDTRHGTLELYDLGIDPKERRNIADSAVAEREQLIDQLERATGTSIH